MNFEQYANLAARTQGTYLCKEDQLNCAALGLSGEAGEFADLVKKVMYHQHPLELNKLTSELGDILWYVALACDALDLQMADVANKNIAKLKERYPNGFDPERSINRG